MTGQPTRRRWLALCGGSVLTGLAGCSSDGSESGDDGEPAATEASHGDDEGTGGADDGDTNEQGSSGDPADAVLSDVIDWDPSYVVEITFAGDQAGEITQTVHEGDTHIVMDTGMEAEAYDIDGEKYEIVAGRCVIRPNPEAEAQAPDVDDPSADAPEIRAEETTTRHGESVYVFEMPSDEEGRWYVSTDTGYPVEFETPVYTARFRSWGETEPITPPEMDCREV